MKTLLTTAVLMTNFVAMGGVASAQCHDYGYRGGYGRPFGHYGSFKAIPAGRLPANVVFKAIQTEQGIVIVAVPVGVGGAQGNVPNGPTNDFTPPANNLTPPAPVNPQLQPQPNLQTPPQPAAQVTPASVVQNTQSGPASPFFNIPDRTVPSSNFNGGGFQQTGINNGGFNGGNNGGGAVVQNGGNRAPNFVNGGGAVVQNGGNRAPNLVNGGAVRNAPAAAPAPTNVSNGASRFEFRAPPIGRR